MDDITTEVFAGVYLGGPPRTQRSISLENPNLPLNDPAIWDEVFGGYQSSEAGIPVNEDKAIMYAPVWQAVSLIASSVATLPFHHYKYRPDISDTASEWQKNSIYDYLVSVSPSGYEEPNDYQTAIQFWESFMVDALLWNNAYAYIIYDRSMRPRALRLLNPDRTNCELQGNQLWYVTEYTDSDGRRKLKALYPWEVIHVRGLCAYGHQAPPFIRYARNSIGIGLAQQRFVAKFFANGGRIGGILELPVGMPKPVRDQVEEGFRKTYEDSDAPFKTVILRDSAKFHAAQQSPNDAQMVEAGEQQVRMIARWFNLSPALLGLGGSVSYNSKEQDNQAFLDHTLKRWLCKIQAECNLKLLPTNRLGNEFFKHDTSDLVSMDALKMAQMHQIYRQMQVLSANDVRAKLNLLPVEGGNDYSNPSTSSGLAAQQPPDQPDPPDPESDAESETEDQPSEPAADTSRSLSPSEARVLFHLTHVARQKAKNRKSFMEWFYGGFKPQREEWKELGGSGDPAFFANVSARFSEMIDTVTDDALVSSVEAITTTIEKEAFNGTTIYTAPNQG